MADTNGKKTTASKAKKAAVTNSTVAVQKSVLTANALPTADALKARFKAGSIPLQSDFADLIDMANIGRLAVGDSATGWGLNKDSQGRLQWDFSRIYNTSYDLSPSSSSDRIDISDQFSGETSVHNRIALLAINSETGPTRAVNTKSGDSTTFVSNAIKTDEKGKKTRMSVNIIAKKAVGKNGNFIPFEYVTTATASFTLWYTFTLDAPDVDLNSCTLVIDPLMLSINYVTDAAEDPVGEVVSLMIVNFSCNSARQLIPKGLISMFSGSEAPAGWALCNGDDGTPDLRDRFILGGGFAYSGGKSTETLAGDKNNKELSFTSENQTVVIKGSTKGHTLTSEENGPHSHYQGETLNHQAMCHNTYEIETQNKVWVNGGAASAGTGMYRPRTYADGGGKAHSHDIEITTGSHSHSNKLTVPYYILAFIMKM